MLALWHRDAMRAKNSLLKKCKKFINLNLKAQRVKKHWNKLSCISGYDLTCLSGTSWLGWVRVDVVQVDLGTTWPDTSGTTSNNVHINSIPGKQTETSMLDQYLPQLKL